MELEEAIKVLVRIKKNQDRCAPNVTVRNNACRNIEAIETVLNHITKKDKMIELMARFIDTELSSEHLSKVLKIDVKPLETYREKIKQYFEKKAEESE